MRPFLAAAVLVSALCACQQTDPGAARKASGAAPILIKKRADDAPPPAPAADAASGRIGHVIPTVVELPQLELDDGKATPTAEKKKTFEGVEGEVVDKGHTKTIELE